MKTNIILIITLLFTASCATYRQDFQTKVCEGGPNTGQSSFTKGPELKSALDQLVRHGVPGCALVVCSNEGWWSYASGVAKIEDQTPMQTCHLQYLQSISKTYLAVAVLKLFEQGKIDLDAPVTKYLPQQYSRYINSADKITVRMLLNHTSGIPEYNFAPSYVSYLLQHPDHKFMPEDYIKYVNRKSLDFEPGSRYSYRNTNYLLLALMMDALTGDHASFMQDNIFTPLGLTQTFYRNEKSYLTYPSLVNSYWDRYGDGVLENVSQMQRNNVSSLIGDDGIVATPTDAILFLKGLNEGKLLSTATLEQMQTWVKDSKGNPRYGLGLGYGILHGAEAYGHSGGGIGAGCDLRYFPSNGTYMFVAVNLGTVTESPIHKEAEKVLSEIQRILAK